MKIFLVIGELQAKQFVAPQDAQNLREVRVTAGDSDMAGMWPLNEIGEKLRDLLGGNPTDVIGIAMPEEVWLSNDSVVNVCDDYFPACEAMWVSRPNGTFERVR